MEYYPYYKKRGYKNKGVVQPNVVQSEKKQFRVSGKGLKQFNDHFRECEHRNESLFIKELIKEALDNREKLSWAEEVEDINGKNSGSEAWKEAIE